MKKRTFSPWLPNYSPLLALLFILAISNLSAQEIETRLLLDSLEKTSVDSLKIDMLNEVSWQLKRDHPDSAKQYAQRAISLAKERDMPIRLATAYNRYGVVEKGIGNIKNAIIYYDSALVIERTENNLKGIARASNQLASLHKSLGDFEKAKTYATYAVSAFRKDNDVTNLAKSLSVLANIFTETSQYDSSLLALNESLQIRENTGDELGKATVLLNLGSLFERMKNYDRALSYSRKSLSIYDSLDITQNTAVLFGNIGNAFYKKSELDSAEKYYLQSLSIREKQNNEAIMAPSYSNLANIYEARGQLRKAEDYHLKGLNIRQQTQDINIIISYFNLGRINVKTNKQEVALSYFLKASDIVDSLNLQKSHSYVLKAISDCYATLQQPEQALAYSNLYSDVQEQIQADVTRVNNLELNIQKGRNELVLLKSENQRQALENSKQQITIYSLIGGIILFLLLFFAIYRITRLRSKSIISRKNEELQRKKIEQLIKDKEVDAMSAMAEGQEAERLRIARDLHDRLGGTLSIVKMHFKSVEEGIRALKETNVQQYQEANHLLDEACEEVRKIAHDMTSGVLMKFGLVAALEDLKATVESTGQLKVNLIDIGLEERLNYDYEINIYRIIQELLTNTLKYARAREFSVQLFRKEKSLSIVVEDNGIGFKPEQVTAQSGIGLKNIESRVNKFDGEVIIDSGRGAGTTITIDLPLKDERL